MRLPKMAVFHTVGAAVMAMSVRLARWMNFTGHRPVAEAPDLNRVADLADQLAARILAAIEGGELTAEELAEVDLILRTATILQQAGVKFPPNMCRLGEKAAEQTQFSQRERARSERANGGGLKV
jgi:hypothetical protein